MGESLESVSLARQRIEAFAERVRTICASLHEVLVGQDATIDQLLICALTGSHALLVGVPGLAKTLMVRAGLRVRMEIRGHPIHARPDALRHDGLRTAGRTAEERVVEHQTAAHALAPEKVRTVALPLQLRNQQIDVVQQRGKRRQRAARATVAPLVVGHHTDAGPAKPFHDSRITSRVFSQAVHDPQDARRAFAGCPSLSEQGRAISCANRIPCDASRNRHVGRSCKIPP